MTRLTIAYANHRPETLPLSQPIMQEHRVIILEEPRHPLFKKMLAGQIKIADYLFDQDIEYPAFSLQQCRMMRHMYRGGRKIFQIEPFIDHLIEVQNFFADGNSPKDLDSDSTQYQVYQREKESTKALIEYYQAVRKEDFSGIVESLKVFARADAKRFILRDRLRAEAIVSKLNDSRSACVEAGPMHLQLYHSLKSQLPLGWSVNPVFVEHRGFKTLGLKPRLYGPGDRLTIHYLFKHRLPPDYMDLLCARTLVFTKIVQKEEYPEGQSAFPHLRDESEAITLVSKLSYSQCRRLFFDIRDKSTEEAKALVRSLASPDNNFS